MQISVTALFSRLPNRANRSAWTWIVLWAAVSVLAWSLAFTFSPARPYKFTLKFLHVLIFLPWSIASIRGWRAISGRPANLRVELSAMFAAAGLIELAERWIPGHEPDWVGFSCSSLGVALAGWILRRCDAPPAPMDPVPVSNLPPLARPSIFSRLWRSASRHWRYRSQYRSLMNWLFASVNRGAGAFPPLSRFHGLHFHVRLKNEREPLLLRWGATDALVLQDVFFEGEYRCVLRGLHRPPERIVDLGANAGYSVRWWLSLYPQAHILAVEPDPDNAEVCRRNVELAGAGDRVTLVRACIGARPRDVQMISDAGECGCRMRECGPGEASEIRVETLPALLERSGWAGPVDLLKCDIEGAEAELFADCASWIGRVQWLVVELHAPYNLAHLRDDLGRNGARMRLCPPLPGQPEGVVFLTSVNADG